MRDERTIRALSQSLHQIELAQSVEARIGIGFAVGSECRIDQRNPRGRNRASSSRIDGLHVDARFVTRFRAAKYNILAIREKMSVTPVDGIMRDLLCLPRAKGNQEKLTGNVQNKGRQNPLHVR